MFDENFKSDAREGTRAISLGTIWTILIVLVIGGLSIGIWAFRVATAPVVGKGNQYIHTHSEEWMTQTYEKFYRLDADIRTQVENAAVAKKTLDKFEATHSPADDANITIGQTHANLQTAYDGNVQICNDNVNKYNADAANALRDQYLDSRLPQHFNAAVCTGDGPLPPSPPASYR
jgi:hypothetical protein